MNNWQILFFISIFLFLPVSCSDNTKTPVYVNPVVLEKDFNSECITKTEISIINGNSLSGVVEDGDEVKIMYGYYDCNPVRLNDMIIYNYSGNDNPLIKIVKAVSGDNFTLEKSDNRWNIIINSRLLANSQGNTYRLDQDSYKMLSLYEMDYHGKIPAGAYLIMGNRVSGTLDSSRFGLVSKEDFLGKAVI